MEKKFSLAAENHGSSFLLLRLRPLALHLGLAFGMFALGGDPAWALPQGATVVAGSASFQQQGVLLTVNTGGNTILNWQRFGIGVGEMTRFVQPSAASAVLNRVTGGDPSQILGSLSSNGRVFLINPSGIVFGAGAKVDTAAFVASTLNITDQNFLQGRLLFEGNGAAIRNEGDIKAVGNVFFVAPDISNSGAIRSEGGSVVLAAGQKVLLSEADPNHVVFEVKAPQSEAVNLGRIEAGNSVAMFASSLRHSGTIRASGMVAGEGGKVILTGNDVRLAPGGSIDVSASNKGGTVLVGGDVQGGNSDIPNAAMTVMEPGARINADATQKGDGGKVVLWSEDSTRFAGTISARGGKQGGNGGFIETSGKRSLQVENVADAGASNGRPGVWLLDPNNITINSTGPDTNITGGPNFTTTDDGAVIAASTIQTALNSGTSVSLTTSTAGANLDDGTIAINAPITVNAPASVSFSLSAHKDIQVNADVTSTSVYPLTVNLSAGMAGAGAITGAGAFKRNGAGSYLLDLKAPNGNINLSGNNVVDTVNLNVVSGSNGDVYFNSTGTGSMLVQGPGIGIAAGNNVKVLHGGSVVIDNHFKANASFILETPYFSMGNAAAEINAADVDLKIDNLNLSRPINASNSFSVKRYTPGTEIQIGGSDSASILGIDDTEFAWVSSNIFRIGDLTSSGNLTFYGATPSLASKTVSVKNLGTIGQSAAVSANALSVESGAAVALDTLDNNVAVLAGKSASADFNFKNGSTRTLTIGSVDGLNGIEANNITLTAGQNIQDVSAGVIKTGNLTVNANHSSGAQLNNATHQVNALTVTSAGPFSFRNSQSVLSVPYLSTSGLTVVENVGDLNLGSLSTSGNVLTLRAHGGSILDGNSSAVNVSNVYRVDFNDTNTSNPGAVGAANDAIEVSGNASAVFVTARAKGGGIFIADTGMYGINLQGIAQDGSVANNIEISSVAGGSGLTVGASIVTAAGNNGDVKLTSSGGGMTIGAPINKAGTGTLLLAAPSGSIAINSNLFANGGNLVVNSAGSVGSSGSASLSGKDIAITGTGGINAANLSLQATGDTTLAADIGSNITADNSGNLFAGKVSISGGNNVSLKASENVVLGPTTQAGNLTVVAGAGGVTGYITGNEILGGTSATLSARSGINLSGANTPVSVTLNNSVSGAISYNSNVGAASTLLVNGSNVAASGDFNVSENSGNLAIPYPSSPGISAGGNINLQASGAGKQISVNNSVTSASGSVSFASDRFSIDASSGMASANNGAIEIKPYASGVPISVAVNDPGGALYLPGVALGRFSTPLLKLGKFDAGDIRIDESITLAAASVPALSLISGGTISQGAGANISVQNLNADGKNGVFLDQSNAVSVLAGGSETGSFYFNNSGALQIGSVDIKNGVVADGTGQSLTLVASGDISQTAAAPLVSNSTLNVNSTSGNVLLDNPNNRAGGLEASAPNGGFSYTSAASVPLQQLSGSAVTQKILVPNQIVTIPADFMLTATGTGDALVLSAKGFNNLMGASALSTPNGRWLVYSGVSDPALDNRGGLAFGFKEYNRSYAAGAYAGPGSGNGFIYSYAPSALVANLAGTISKVYDGTTVASLSAGNFTVSGLIDGDSAAVSSWTAAAYDSKSVGVGKTVSASNPVISASNSGMPVYGYSLPATASGVTGEITVKTVSVTGAVAQNKVYDGTPSATLSGAALAAGGIVAGDTVNLGGSGVFSDKNVGTAKSVTAALSLTGIDAANYQLVQPTGLTANISAASLMVGGLNANNKTYDGTVVATLSGTPTAVPLAGDSVTLSGSASASFADKNVGTAKPVTVSGYTLSGTDAGNYVLLQPTGLSANIAAANLTVGGLSANNKIYDGTVAATLSGTATVVPLAGDSVTLSGSASASFADKNVGTGKPVTVGGYTLTGTDAGNYALLQPAGLTATITKAGLTVTGAIAQDKIYDGNVNATIGNASLVGVIPGDSVTLSGGGAFSTPDVGASKPVTAVLSLGGGDAGNYQLTQPGGLTASILSATPLASSPAVQSSTTQVTNLLVTTTTSSGEVGGSVSTSPTSTQDEQKAKERQSAISGASSTTGVSGSAGVPACQ